MFFWLWIASLVVSLLVLAAVCAADKEFPRNPLWWVVTTLTIIPSLVLGGVGFLCTSLGKSLGAMCQELS